MTRSRRRKLNREQQATQRRGLVRTSIRTTVPVASALLMAMHGAHAQNAPAATAAAGGGGGGLEEVVVTAQKRVENLQSVPVSVEVLDTQRLQQLDVTNLDDYVKYSPSVSYQRGQGEGSNGQPGDQHVYIRGVVSGGDGNHSGSQPSVGTYFDEQPVTTIDGTPDVHIYDVQRIEVLEGPQGTLYGASSESGTIRIISNKPDPTHFAGGYDLDVNQIHHGGSGYTAEGFVNIPLADFAAVRLVGWTEHDGGFISNVQGTNLSACIVNGVRTFPTWDGAPAGGLAPCPPVGTIGAGAISNASSAKLNYNTADIRGGRASLRFEFGDWTITPQFMGQDIDANGFFGYDPGVGTFQLVHYGPEKSQDNWQQTALTIEGKFSDFDLVYAGAYMKRIQHTIAEYSDYSEFYDRLFGSGAYWVGNNGQPIMPEEFVVGRSEFEKWSHEVRLTTPVQYPLKATLGLFIQRQLHDIYQQYTMPGYGGDPYGAVPNPNGFGYLPPNNFSLPGYPNTIWLTDEQRVDRDKAVFAQGQWDIASPWALQAGFRYYEYRNSLAGFFGYNDTYSSHTGVAACFAPTTVKGTPCTNLDTEVADTGWVPRVNLTYKANRDHMLYLTYSKGFRPGGVNRVTGPFPPYKADYLTNYEFGWKTQWFDHHLRWNGALFWEDWKNFQFSFLVPPSITAIANGGNARIKGIENELEWAVAGGLTLSTNFTFLDPVLTQNYCGVSGLTYCPNLVTTGPFLPGGQIVGPLAPAGTNLPVVPKFKGNVVIRYNLNTGTDWIPYAQADYVYQTKTAPLLRADEEYTLGMQPAYGLLDVRAGTSYNSLSLELYCTNVTNKIAQLSRFTEFNQVNDPQVYIIPAQPRTFGVKFAQRF